MGSAGMGMVSDFGTLWHTAYPCCGVTGIHGNIVNVFIYYFYYYILPLFDILRWDFRVEFETPPNVWSSDHSLILRHGSHLKMQGKITCLSQSPGANNYQSNTKRGK